MFHLARKIECRKINGGLQIAVVPPTPNPASPASTFPSSRGKSQSDISRREIKCRVLRAAVKYRNEVAT